MVQRTLPAALAMALLAAPGALASDHNMRVNEIYPAAPGQAFVELLDVLPGGERFPQFQYIVAAYDGAGARVSSLAFNPPYPFSFRTTPFVLGDGGDAPALALPASGEVCFEVADPVQDKLHCLPYGSVPTGRSVQRQACGKAAVAPPTRGQENAVVAAACAGAPPCDDPRQQDNIPPKMTVKAPRVQDVDRFGLRVTLSEDGDVTVRGGLTVGTPPPADPNMTGTPPGTFVYGPMRRKVRANVPLRIKIPLSRKARRAVKRGARRGKTTRASILTVGRDSACFRNRAHSRRQIELTP